MERCSHASKLEENNRTKKSKSSDSKQVEINVKRCNNYVKEGQYTKASQALTSAGLAQPSPETKAKIQELYPQCPSILTEDEEPSVPPLQFSPSHVSKAIMAFKPGTVPGPSGLGAQHLK